VVEEQATGKSPEPAAWKGRVTVAPPFVSAGTGDIPVPRHPAIEPHPLPIISAAIIDRFFLEQTASPKRQNWLSA